MSKPLYLNIGPYMLPYTDEGFNALEENRQKERKLKDNIEQVRNTLASFKEELKTGTDLKKVEDEFNSMVAMSKYDKVLDIDYQLNELKNMSIRIDTVKKELHAKDKSQEKMNELKGKLDLLVKKIDTFNDMVLYNNFKEFNARFKRYIELIQREYVRLNPFNISTTEMDRKVYEFGLKILSMESLLESVMTIYRIHGQHSEQMTFKENVDKFLSSLKQVMREYNEVYDPLYRFEDFIKHCFLTGYRRNTFVDIDIQRINIYEQYYNRILDVQVKVVGEEGERGWVEDAIRESISERYIERLVYLKALSVYSKEIRELTFTNPVIRFDAQDPNAVKGKIIEFLGDYRREFDIPLDVTVNDMFIHIYQRVLNGDFNVDIDNLFANIENDIGNNRPNEAACKTSVMICILKGVIDRYCKTVKDNLLENDVIDRNENPLTPENDRYKTMLFGILKNTVSIQSIIPTVMNFDGFFERDPFIEPNSNMFFGPVMYIPLQVYEYMGVFRLGLDRISYKLMMFKQMKDKMVNVLNKVKEIKNFLDKNIKQQCVFKTIYMNKCDTCLRTGNQINESRFKFESPLYKTLGESYSLFFSAENTRNGVIIQSDISSYREVFNKYSEEVNREYIRPSTINNKLFVDIYFQFSQVIYVNTLYKRIIEKHWDIFNDINITAARINHIVADNYTTMESFTPGTLFLSDISAKLNEKDVLSNDIKTVESIHGLDEINNRGVLMLRKLKSLDEESIGDKGLNMFLQLKRSVDIYKLSISSVIGTGNLMVSSEKVTVNYLLKYIGNVPHEIQPYKDELILAKIAIENKGITNITYERDNADTLSLLNGLNIQAVELLSMTYNLVEDVGLYLTIKSILDVDLAIMLHVIRPVGEPIYDEYVKATNTLKDFGVIGSKSIFEQFRTACIQFRNAQHKFYNWLVTDIGQPVDLKGQIVKLLGGLDTMYNIPESYTRTYIDNKYKEMKDIKDIKNTPDIKSIT